MSDCARLTRDGLAVQGSEEGESEGCAFGVFISASQKMTVMRAEESYALLAARRVSAACSCPVLHPSGAADAAASVFSWSGAITEQGRQHQ